MADELTRSSSRVELGVAGSRVANQYNQDDFLPQLRGHRAIKTFREMRDNDAIIGAILQGMEMMMRSVEWRVEAADDSEEAEQERAFVESLWDDMDSTWEEWIAEVMSFLPFGFSLFETVFKQRVGPNQRAKDKRSKYTDGRIGIRKLAPRSQWTIDRWDIDDSGEILAAIQMDPDGGGNIRIPMEKALLFRTTTLNNSPSGRSILRNSYTSWYYASNLQHMEAIRAERDLKGIPVGRIPSEYLTADSGTANGRIRDEFVTILRDMKFNEQGYAILPSDTYEDKDGNPTSTRMMDIELMGSPGGQGSSQLDIGERVRQYQQDMARSVLADFIMLGSSDKGSFALSQSKTDLFLRSLQGYLSSISAQINRNLLPRLWRLNGLDPALMPRMVPGEVAPVDLAELGQFVQRLAGAGLILFPDEELENDLRAKAGLPERRDDDVEMMGRMTEE